MFPASDTIRIRYLRFNAQGVLASWSAGVAWEATNDYDDDAAAAASAGDDDGGELADMRWTSQLNDGI